ncbi:MAG: CHASE2 domain-containing protein [Elainellaceae cyanobacterium]
MTHPPSTFQLKVQRVERLCLFELTWPQGRRLNAELPFPNLLMQRYQEWQTTYLNFYQTVQIPLTVAPDEDGLRGKAVGGGSVVAAPKDWRMRLVEAETRLLYDFHQWLRSPELYDMRAQIAQASRHLSDTSSHLDLFLTCTPIEVSRLPWEAWEIGTEFAAIGRVRIARTPANIRNNVSPRPKSRRRPRILAILGDDTGLNFEGDRTAIQSLNPLAKVHFVGWKPGKDIDELKQEIVTAIADEQGWDILFFAGHSNEKASLGGELAIAPNTAIAVNEIKAQLAIAQRRGLQFALFNSCNGLDIAETLIDLGLSQVAVMREPSHNRVAEEFLVRFLQSLATYHDVHESLILATECLKSRTNLTHPSAHLVPTLFRHPDSPLFQLHPVGWQQRLQKLLPTRYEAIALTLLALLSWQLPVQSWLLERRMAVQALYRHSTGQFSRPQPPPVLLVQIDDESIGRNKVDPIVPMSRDYLAQLVARLTALEAEVIGLDYLLDYVQAADDQLAQALQAAADQGIPLVFAATQSQNGGWLFALPELVPSQGSRHGDMRYRRLGNAYYLMLLPTDDRDGKVPNPLGYELAMRHPTLPPPTLRPMPTALSRLSYGLHQMWLHPVIDFSIPPNQIYQRLPAWELLAMAETQAGVDTLPSLAQQVVMIVPGGYRDAGVHADNQDNLPIPAAVAYWRRQATPRDNRPILTGGEVHAYQLHHYLHQRFVVPVPDLWLVGLAALVGKALVLLWPQGRSPLPWLVLATSIGLYTWMSLQVYVSAAILLPVVLPVGTVCLYILPSIIRRKS